MAWDYIKFPTSLLQTGITNFHFYNEIKLYAEDVMGEITPGIQPFSSFVIDFSLDNLAFSTADQTRTVGSNTSYYYKMPVTLSDLTAELAKSDKTYVRIMASGETGTQGIFWIRRDPSWGYNRVLSSTYMIYERYSTNQSQSYFYGTNGLSYSNTSSGYYANSSFLTLVKNGVENLAFQLYKNASSDNYYVLSSYGGKMLYGESEYQSSFIGTGGSGGSTSDYYMLMGYFFLSGSLVGIPPSTYTVTITAPVHGEVSTLQSEAEENETVQIYYAPEVGYILDASSSSIKDENDNSIAFSVESPVLIEFTMPASDVTVTIAFKSNNPYVPGGTSTPSTPGGDGEFNNNSDNIPVPTTPQINYSDSGLVRLFSPSSQQVIDFGNYLWSGLIDLDTIIKAFQDPMQNIISFHMVPIAVDTASSIVIKFAGIPTTVSMYPVTKQLYDVSMGSLQFPKYYGSSLDYSPYTQAVLYLPYIGEIPLDVDECIGKTLTISYKVDVFSGNCVAFVAIDGNVFYTKSGNMLQTIPISQSSFSQIIGTATGLLASALGGASIVGGGIGALGAGTALGTIGNALSQGASIASQAAKPASDLLSVIAGKPQGGHTSLGGGITGFLSVQYPYVNIKRVKQSLSSSFASEYGYPLNVTANLQDYTGFVKVSDIVFNGMTSTDTETGEIYNLLRSGIVIYGNALPTYTAPATGLKVVLEYYTGVPNSPDKSITTKAEITGTFKNNTNLTRPTIYLEGYLNTLLNETNMICIPEFKRRYYIKEIRVVTANSYEIDLICDVLTSFWSEFKTSLCIIERAQNSYNLMIRDSLFVAQQDRLIQQLKFPNSFSTQSYILALTGNNGSVT